MGTNKITSLGTPTLDIKILGKMAGKEVIRAAQMFTKSGVASRTSVVKDILIASVLGGGFGMLWQVSPAILRLFIISFKRVVKSIRCIQRLAFILTVVWGPSSPLPSFYLQRYHWAEDAKWEAYYKSLEEKQA